MLNIAAVYRTIRNHILAERRAPFAILLLVCAWLYGGHLKEGMYSITNEGVPPASLALNFKLALEHGQLPPRLVETAREFYPSGGSLDGVPPTSDMPVFQYYSFLTGALTYPFLIAGIKGARAVGAGMLVAWLMGAAALYFAALSFGAPRRGAFLVSWSYILSPWLISNAYERGGVAEAISHAVLPLLVLGFSWAWTSRYRAAILTIGAGIFALALSHNIFFLYGVSLCALVCIFNFVGTLWIQKPKRWRSIIMCAAAPFAIGFGVLLGMALSAWQWIPALLSVSQTRFDFSGVSQTSNLAFGLMKGDAPFSYSTIGWWTIPSIFVAVLWSRREQWQYAVALAATFAAFFLLTYEPQFVTPHLPGAFSAAQFTSRFLPFLSLIGAFSLSLLRRWSSIPVTVGIGIVIFASEIPVMYNLPPPYNLLEEQLVKAAEEGAYFIGPQFADRPFRMNRGWLKPDTRIYIDRWHQITRAPTGPIHLRVTGRALEGMGTFALQLGSLNEEHPLASAQIDHPEFDVTLTIENPPSQLQLQASHYKVIDSLNEPTFIRPDRVYLIEDPPGSYIYADAVDRVETKGLRRVFKVKDTAAILSRPTKSDDFVIELPIAYSPFFVARQHEKAIIGWADFNYRLDVRTPDLTAPIVVTYEIPTWIWLLAASGLMVALALVVYPRQKLQ